MQLTVVVRDKQGRPVADLQQSDFTIEDEGKPQEIRFFSLESKSGAAGNAVPVEPGVFTNRRVAHSGSTGGVTVILLDGLNTRWGDQAQGIKGVVEYLSQIQPRDHIALYTLGTQLKMLQDFTEEPAELVKALADYRGEQTQRILEASNGTIGGIMQVFREEKNYFMTTRVLTTLGVLEAIAKSLAGVPGRKNLVWVSGGFPLAFGDFIGGVGGEWQGGDSVYSARTYNGRGTPLRGTNPNGKVTLSFERECRNAIRALNAADIAVYPVDARGLTPNRYAYTNISIMRDLAGGTGGKAYYYRNDLMNSIREAVEDSVVSYDFGYYPSEQKLDGRFRKLQVKLKRPGLTARYRRGYYDIDALPPDEKAKEAAIRDALWSPLDATEVTIDAELSTAAAGGSEALGLRIRIDPRNLVLEQRDGRWMGRFDIAVLQTDQKGKDCGISVQTVPLALAPEAYAAISKQGLILNKAVQRSKAANALRVVVRDAISGKVGRVMIPFQDR